MPLDGVDVDVQLPGDRAVGHSLGRPQDSLEQVDRSKVHSPEVNLVRVRSNNRAEIRAVRK